MWLYMQKKDLMKNSIMINNSSDYSDGIAKAFIEQADISGIKIIAKEGYADGDKVQSSAYKDSC